MKKIKGVAASPGIAIGPVFQFRQVDLHFDRCTVDDPSAEMERLNIAIQTASEQIGQVYQKALKETDASQAAIFEAQAAMIQDPELLETIRKTIFEQKLNAESALTDAAEYYASLLEGMDNEYFRARAADVRDISNRILRVLLGVTSDPKIDLKSPSIIVARDLTPSDTILLDKSLVLGFCTIEGGETSHTAILARGLGLPAIVGSQPEIMEIDGGRQVVLDGSEGLLLQDPDENTIQVYRQKKKTSQDIQQQARAKCRQPAVTRNNHPVEVVANIGNVQSAHSAIEHGAEGVGLLRTEFLYLERATMPDEEEQYQAYRSILEVFGQYPVVLRTSDIGGDKELPYLDLPHEMNPFLGVRGLRLCLTSPELLKPQLRAALRAGVGHNLKLMFPMVSVISEVRRARALLEECRAELVAEGKAIAENLEVGIMVEVPSAAVQADVLAREVDFFSIGTNDLTQYTLAVDRTNAQLAYLTSAFSPAVLRLIQSVIQAAHKHGKWVGLCGELAGEPLAIPILLGLGLDEFSMNPPAIPMAKEIIRSLDIAEAQEIAAAALDREDGAAVKSFVRERVKYPTG